MNINTEIYEAHRMLSNCSAEFLDFVKENPACLDRASFEDVLSTSLGSVRPHPWPTFINEKTREMFDTAAVEVYKLISSIPERLFAFDPGRIIEYYGFPESAVKLMLRGIENISLPDLLSRGDFIYSSSAGFKCLEFNVVSNIGGGWQLDILEPLYFKTPILARFLKEYNAGFSRVNFSASLVNHVLNRALTHFSPGQDDEINVAVVYSKFDPSNVETALMVSGLKDLYRGILRQKYGNLKGELVITDLFRLIVKDGRVYYNANGENKKIHVIVEKCNGLVPAPLMNVVENGNVLLFNGPISHLLSSKLNLALLSEHEDSDLFSPEERAVIKKYIPWTRKVTAGLEDFVLEHREGLVLKPGDGVAGYGVCVGYNTPHDQWKQRVAKALEDKNWVVQEYIPSYSYFYQEGESGAVEHHMVWGIFVIGSRGCGGVARVLSAKNHKGVINVRQGARLNIILEAAEANLRIR